MTIRTALYVSQPTTLSFFPASAKDRTAELLRFHQLGICGRADGDVALERGIYRILSQDPVSVTGPYFRAEVVINDKDEWPDPPVSVLELEPGATAKEVKLFFTIVKMMDV